MLEKCNVLTNTVCVYAVNSTSGVVIKDCNIKSKQAVGGNINSNTHLYWKHDWKIIRNYFEGYYSRDTDTSSVGRVLGRNSIFAYNDIHNIHRGILSQHHTGPCIHNLVMRNCFEVSSHTEAGSENILLEHVGAFHWKGNFEYVYPDRTKVVMSLADYNAFPVNTNMQGKILIFKGGNLNGTLRWITKVDGRVLTLNKPLSAQPENTTGYISTGAAYNNIVSNKMQNTLGGIVLYGNCYDNLISNSTMWDCGYGIWIYGNERYFGGYQLAHNWYNTIQKPELYRTPIRIDALRQLEVTEPNLVMGTHVYYGLYNQSNISMTDSVATSGSLSDTYYNAIPSGTTIPVVVQDTIFAKSYFNPISHVYSYVVDINKIPYGLINLSPHGVSGILLSDYSNNLNKISVHASSITPNFTLGFANITAKPVSTFGT